MDNPLAKQLHLTSEELAQALATPEFYVSALYILIALALAWLVAYLIRSRVTRHILEHPPRRIDAEFLIKPLELLGPLLAILYLGIARPLVQEYGNEAWVDALVSLSVAYLVVKCVLLLMRFKPMAYFIASLIMVIAVLDVTGFMESTSKYLSAMALEIGTFRISVLNLVHGLIILVIVFWIAGVLSRTLESYLRRSSSLSYNSRELIVKFFKLFVYFTALMITLSTIGVDLTAFAVFGGAVGVGVGLGLQKIAANFLSGIMLLAEKSIKIGDLIEVSGLLGWVRQLNVRYTLVETLDGRAIIIPNDELINTKTTSWTYTDNQARIEFKVGVPYDTDAKRAHDLMVQAAREHPKCLKDPPPACHLREFGELGLVFQLAFWIGDIREGRLGPQSDVMFSILQKFREAGITIQIKQT